MRAAPLVPPRRAARDDELPVHRQAHPPEPREPLAYRTQRPRGAGAQERPDRRDRRRSPDGVLRDGGAGRGRRHRRPVPEPRRSRALRDGLRAGQLAPPLRQQGAQPTLGERDDQERSRRAGSRRPAARPSSGSASAGRRPPLADPEHRTPRPGPGRGVSIAVASTLVFFGRGRVARHALVRLGSVQGVLLRLGRCTASRSRRSRTRS